MILRWALLIIWNYPNITQVKEHVTSKKTIEIKIYKILKQYYICH